LVTAKRRYGSINYNQYATYGCFEKAQFLRPGGNDREPADKLKCFDGVERFRAGLAEQY
jgi:hypothetical protein